MILLKLAGLALLGYALVVAAFQTLGPIAAVPVAAGVLVGAWRVRRPEPEPVNAQNG